MPCPGCAEGAEGGDPSPQGGFIPARGASLHAEHPCGHHGSSRDGVRSTWQGEGCTGLAVPPRQSSPCPGTCTGRASVKAPNSQRCWESQRLCPPGCNPNSMASGPRPICQLDGFLQPGRDLGSPGSFPDEKLLCHSSGWQQGRDGAGHGRALAGSRVGKASLPILG